MIEPQYIKPSAALKPVFGTHALPQKREALRKKAGGASDSKIGRWVISCDLKRALTYLFENLKTSLYPKHLIIETGTPDDIPITTLCYHKGYVVKGRGRLNLMLSRDD